ncbi:hypothetical protein, partial [Methylobacterium sp. Leaf102]|uniref:hypothetical protein n=1 Tax=Methylobacterium sp. Leaf102 TaxID=1736253 RepID=UPI001AEC1D51
DQPIARRSASSLLHQRDENASPANLFRRRQALDALQGAADKIGQESSGRFSGVANSNGYNVTIRGALVNGQAEIGTAFIP